MEPLRADLFDEICPSSLLPFRMATRWAPLVVRCLEDGPRRFSELRVPLHRTSAKELTRTLRALERDGFVLRTDDAGTIRYALTPLGRSLLGPLESFCRWSAEHWDELLDARDPVA